MYSASPIRGSPIRGKAKQGDGGNGTLEDENVDLKRKVSDLMRQLSDQKLQQSVRSPTTP
jgi:hypothetical protein